VGFDGLVCRYRLSDAATFPDDEKAHANTDDQANKADHNN
jgi:hypothetical protein